MKKILHFISALVPLSIAFGQMKDYINSLITAFFIIIPLLTKSQVQLELVDKITIVDNMPGADTSSQRFLLGRIYERSEEKKPVSALIKIKGTDIYTYSDKDGYYLLDYSKVPKDMLSIVATIECPGYLFQEKELIEAYMRKSIINFEILKINANGAKTN
mgnify:FL=1